MSETDYSSYAVLLVDDETFIRNLTKRLLSGLGFSNFLEAGNGEDALEIIDDPDTAVDLMLCDLMMPDMDGIEVVRHLSTREDRPAIAFLSGADSAVLKAASSLAQARRLNVLGSLSKPVGREELLNVLANLDSEFTPRAKRSVPDIAEADLKRGIEADELVFHYQPKVSIKDGSLSSVEALVRWNHPEHGMVFPDAFIGLAEQGSLITPMTEKLVEIGLRQLADWNAEGFDTSVGINLSPSMLSDVTLPDRLALMCEAYQLDPERVILEITETGMPEDEAIYMEIVTRLHMKGFAISIDDFGTGQSSLLKLEALPFSELKIDRAFVDGASNDPTKRAILEASVSLAKSMELKVVGEGVEEQADWDILAEVGCDLVQGYYLARPMPPEALVSWVKERG